MRLTTASILLTLAVASAIAGPVAKVTEKKSLVENTKLEKDAPKIEEIGDQKDRSKKSTTTFCVEIRPGTNEAVQTPCACKDKAGKVPQSASLEGPRPVPQSAPQPAPASAPPSVNIIHAPPQAPQTLNIIQPAPLHTVHFMERPSAPSAIQNLHIVQPAANLPEPVPQVHYIAKPAEETRPNKPDNAEIIVKPSEPAPQAALKPQHPEQSQKSEVHVSVVTEDNNKKQEEQKPHLENLVQPAEKPAEANNIVPALPYHQPSAEQYVVVPNNMMMVQPEPCQHSGALVQVSSMSPVSFYQPQGSLLQPQGSLLQPQGSLLQPQGSLLQPQASLFQLPSSMYQQQGGPILTECSCKQTHPTSSMIVSAPTKAESRHAKILPMVIYPPPAPAMPTENEKSAVTVHCSEPSHSASASASASAPSPSPSHSNDSPIIVNMQTVRSKDGMHQGGQSDLVRSALPSSMRAYPPWFVGREASPPSSLNSLPPWYPLTVESSPSMNIYPPGFLTGRTASNSNESPVTNVQTARSQDEKSEATDMNKLSPLVAGEKSASRVLIDTPSSYVHGHVHHSPKVIYDVVPGMQSHLYKEPFGKPYYGGHQFHMDISRQGQSTLENSKQEETNQMKEDSTPVSGPRIARSDNDATSKVEDKVTEEKTVEKKTSSVKTA